MSCNIKRQAKPLSHPHKGLLVKDRRVYLELWLQLCVRCVPQVCSSTHKVLSQPQGCVCAAAWGHSSTRTELGFFSCPSAEWRARCVPLPRPDSPPFLCAQPIPPIPSFSSLSPKPRETAPLAVSTVPLGPVHCSVSSPSFIAALELRLKCSYFIMYILQMQTWSNLTPDWAAIRFFG